MDKPCGTKDTCNNIQTFGDWGVCGVTDSEGENREGVQNGSSIHEENLSGRDSGT